MLRENWRQKPSGQPQRPILKVTMGPALMELALRVTIADSVEMQKAAKYIYDLGLYIQTDKYDKTREYRNKASRASKAKKKEMNNE